MQLVVYYLIYPVLLVISIVPWRIFYMLASFVYLLVYYIIGYRKKTVKENLTLVFPEKNDQEIKKIMKAFYKHMCDMFLEMIRTLSISEQELTNRFLIKNTDKLAELETKNKSIIVMMGHYNSYEWTIAIDLLSKFKCVGIYKPIKNKHFDELAHSIRARFGSILVPSRKATKVITYNERQDQPELNMYGLISDQSPNLLRTNFWTDFMGIKVPAFMGGEILAKRLDLSIYYLDVKKVKRGYYEATLVPIAEEPRNVEDYFITTSFIKKLEKQIREKPENYLWTHKRWKHRNATIPENDVVR